jgi:predicted TIM-barrel fold metal-dependent hydrolase
MILDHAPGYILFGTDSPWSDQTEELARWHALGLPDDVLAAALGGNAARLLQG